MKIVFKKDKTRKYVCFTCDKQFNWNKNSRRFGKMEYKTQEEERKIDKKFCSSSCAKKYIESLK